MYKDECALSFDNRFTDGGLYLNLLSLKSFGERFFLSDASKSGCKLYLHDKWQQIPATSDTATDTSYVPSKLGVDINGGFQSNQMKFDIIKEQELVVVFDANIGSIKRILLPNANLPEFLQKVIEAVNNHSGMTIIQQQTAWDAENEKIVSKYAENLIQLNNGKKISNDPSTWRCEASGDTQNLWLNLSTGYIGGGRKNWDGTGGSGAALAHYQETGNLYPLCVKLGTITAHGADIWSYAPDEDCLVIDPQLPQHLAHWGINIMTLEKTDKTLSEMDVELNLKYDWSKLTETNEELQMLRGPGYVGLKNIGSSCYMNSVLQVVMALPEFQDRYFHHRDKILSTITDDPHHDFSVQFSKVAEALLTDKYVAVADDDSEWEVVNMPLTEEKPSLSLEKFTVAPRALKDLVGRNHPEFSTGRQQDAYEYFLHLLDVMARSERTNLPRLIDDSNIGHHETTSKLFEFYFEQKLQCTVTGQVKYSKPSRQTLVNSWDLRIPLEKAINLEQVEEARQLKRQRTEESKSDTIEDVKLLVPFERLLSDYFSDDMITYTNPGLGYPAPTIKSTKFQTFPKYLMVKLGRYYVDENWKQVKVDACVPMPENMDLSSFRAMGKQPGEEEMPSEFISHSQAATQSVVTADEAIVSQLVSMGFSENGSKRAAIATANADAEVAMNWVFEHMDDPDFNDPIDNSSPKNEKGKPSVNQEHVMMLSAMGYSDHQATAALAVTNNDIERAADWLFSHTEDLDAAVNEVP